jgi:prophage maintenance system killer protein
MKVLPVSITLEEITGIHDAALARYGGKPGVRAEECLEQVLGNAMLAEQYGGNEDGSLGICFIGSLMFYLIKGQCFVDVNKRTGLGVTLFLLSQLGLTLKMSQHDLTVYCEKITTDRTMQSGDVVIWIAENAVQESS